jgi:hypothetical protein
MGTRQCQMIGLWQYINILLEERYSVNCLESLFIHWRKMEGRRKRPFGGSEDGRVSVWSRKATLREGLIGLLLVTTAAMAEKQQNCSEWWALCRKNTDSINPIPPKNAFREVTSSLIKIKITRKKTKWWIEEIKQIFFVLFWIIIIRLALLREWVTYNNIWLFLHIQLYQMVIGHPPNRNWELPELKHHKYAHKSNIDWG